MAKVIMINHLTLDGVVQAPGRVGRGPPRRLRVRRLGSARKRRDHGEGDDGSVSRGGSVAVRAAYLRTTKRLLADAARQPVQHHAGEHPEVCRDPNPQHGAGVGIIDHADHRSSCPDRALKEQGTSLVIFGSAELTQALTDAGLVDRYVVMIHPVLGRVPRAAAVSPTSGSTVPTAGAGRIARSTSLPAF